MLEDARFKYGSLNVYGEATNMLSKRTLHVYADPWICDKLGRLFCLILCRAMSMKHKMLFRNNYLSMFSPFLRDCAVGNRTDVLAVMRGGISMLLEDQERGNGHTNWKKK